jgi:uncharacterized protein YdcH (DUF465 family)
MRDDVSESPFRFCLKGVWQYARLRLEPSQTVEVKHPVSSPTEAIREQLVATNQEYQRLRDEHARYSLQLDQLASKNFLTEREMLEEVRLKKLKLRAKDLMESMVRETQSV